MPIDLAPLLLPLVRSEHAALGAEDDNLNAMDTLAQHEQFVAAAAQVQTLLDHAIYDIRVLPYYLFASFQETGLGGLEVMFCVLDNLLGPSLDAVEPERRRRDYFNKRLAWLFEKLDRTLEYHEKSGSHDWLRWQAGLTCVQLDRTIDAAGGVATRLDSASLVDAVMALGRLLARLRAQKDQFATDAEAAAGAPHAIVLAGDETGAVPGRKNEAAALLGEERARMDEPACGTSELARASQVADLETAVSTSAGGSSPDGETSSRQNAPNGAITGQGLSIDPLLVRPSMFRLDLVVDHSFISLCKRLRAFEILIQQERFAKAAIIAESIAEAVSNFDPRAHFPRLFAEYAALESKHVQTLARYGEERDSPEWRALAQHARVDLERFLEG